MCKPTDDKSYYKTHQAGQHGDEDIEPEVLAGLVGSGQIVPAALPTLKRQRSEKKSKTPVRA